MKRVLIRTSVVLTVLWVGLWAAFTFFVVDEYGVKEFLIMGGGGALVWWGLLYALFWIFAGFGNNKDEGSN